MNLQALKDTLPDYAKDIKLNLSTLLSDTQSALSESQHLGTLLASAYATRHATLMRAAENEVNGRLDAAHLQAAKAAACIMAMNNIYYRFVHISHEKDVSALPPKLRMNVIGSPGIDKADFELYALAVSAINGCGMCIDAHIQSLKHHNLSLEAIHMSIRIAAIVSSVAQVLAIESDVPALVK